MGKKEAHKHYTLPSVSDLEHSIAKEYKTAYATNHFLEEFGNFLFAIRVPSEDLKDSHESRGATDVYDEQLLELYALSLAKAEVAASKATADTAGNVLDNILNETDDLFLGELQKRANWQKYLTLECITGWQDDKRRAALRGLAKKGITLQEKVDEVIAPEPQKPRSFKLLYGLIIANTVLLAALAVGAIYGAIQFKKSQQSMEQNFDMKERAYIHQFYEFADKIDPPKNDKDKEVKRKTPLAERIEQVLQIYENRLIEKGEVKYREVSAKDYKQWGDDFIRRLENGEVNFDKIMEAYFKRKMQGK